MVVYVYYPTLDLIHVSKENNTNYSTWVECRSRS